MLSNLELLEVSEKNLQWFQKNSDTLREKFTNELIAIKDQKVVANARNIDNLLKILKEKGIDDSEVLIEPLSPKDIISIL